MENQLNMDAKINDLLKRIENKRKQIVLIERPNWKTNCSFSYTEENLSNPNRINLHVETSIEKLLKIMAFILEKREFYTKSCTIIFAYTDIRVTPPFTWLGFSGEDWIEDILLRIRKINVQSEHRKLEKLEERLTGLVSPEELRRIELEKIEKEI